MKQNPNKINNCPIKEAVFEVRYVSKLPSEAIFGIIYAAIKDYFPDSQVQPLPVQQIPEQVRMKDDNLKYQALYRLQNNNLSMGIGPKALTFINNGKYVGWEKWYNFFCNLLDKIKDTNVIFKIERIGLRYINIFKENILNNTNFCIKLNDKSLSELTSNFRTEILDSDFVKILQVGNSVQVTIDNQTSVGSVIDIDCIYAWNKSDFFSTYKEVISLAHSKEKDLFFSILKDGFIKKLDPIYEEL